MNRPIGIFDSGFGGLTVFRTFEELMPLETMVYFGDTARVPYGTKSKRTIETFALQDASLLMEYDVKLIVIACNTASALALNWVKNNFPVPVLGVIEPGAKKAVEVTRNKRIGVIGTQATVTSDSYRKTIQCLDPEINVYSRPCPLFVPLVEEGWIEKKATRLIAEEYLEPFYLDDVDVLILGCTHYPLLKKVIQEIVGNNVRLVDSAISCAEETKKILSSLQLEHVGERERPGKQHVFLVSDMPEKFEYFGARFLGYAIEEVKVVDIEEVSFVRT